MRASLRRNIMDGDNTCCCWYSYAIVVINHADGAEYTCGFRFNSVAWNE
jgi:hypothetical protein